METAVKKLNDAGVRRFQEALDAGRATGNVRFVEDLRDNPEFHERVFETSVHTAEFPTAFSMAEYLSVRLSPLSAEDIEGRTGFGNLGLWAWLSIWFFDVVCPPKTDGLRTVGPDERYIPEVRAEFSFHRYYRHRLAGPYRIYQQHGETSFPLLHTPVHKHSGLYRAAEEQQDLMQTASVIEAIGMLYFDRSVNRPRAGAIGSERPGSLRRFTEVVRQLDLTHDLQALTGEMLIRLLPEEFQEWRSEAAVSARL